MRTARFVMSLMLGAPGMPVNAQRGIAIEGGKSGHPCPIMLGAETKGVTARRGEGKEGVLERLIK
jgi:hypothetical protein